MRSSIAVLALISMVVAEPVEGQERRWLATPRLLVEIDDNSGVVLGQPSAVASGPEGEFVVIDRSDQTLHYFDSNGNREWVRGRTGQGPGEFVAMRDVVFNSEGSVRVLDVELNRVSEFSSAGDLVGTQRVDGAPVTMFLVDDAVALQVRGADLLWRSPESGRQARRPAELNFDHPLAGEPFSGSGPEGTAIAYRWGSLLVALDRSGRVENIFDGVEPIPFPPVSPPPVERVDRTVAVRAARSATRTTTHLFVLFRGRSDKAGRIVDVYSIVDGEYVGSLELPDPTAAISATSDGRLITVESEMWPRIRIWDIGNL